MGRHDEKNALVVEHPLDFVAGGFQVVYEFKNAYSNNAVEIAIGKWKGGNRSAIELGVSISPCQPLGHRVGMAMNIDSIKFSGMQRQLGH